MTLREPLPFIDRLLELYGETFDLAGRGRLTEALDAHARAGDLIRAERERRELKVKVVSRVVHGVSAAYPQPVHAQASKVE